MDTGRRKFPNIIWARLEDRASQNLLRWTTGAEWAKERLTKGADEDEEAPAFKPEDPPPSKWLVLMNRDYMISKARRDDFPTVSEANALVWDNSNPVLRNFSQ